MEDKTSRIELTIFSDVYNQYQHALEKDKLVIVEGEVNLDEYSGAYRILVKRLYTMTQAREHFGKALTIKVVEQNVTTDLPLQLQQILAPFCPGLCPVLVEYHRLDSSVKLLLGENWRVKPTEELIKACNTYLGVNSIVVEY